MHQQQRCSFRDRIQRGRNSSDSSRIRKHWLQYLHRTQIAHSSSQSATNPSNWLIPRYFACYHPTTEPKSIIATERQRKALVVAQHWHDLHQTSVIPDQCSSAHLTSSSPFITPLVKLGKSDAAYRRKYKYIRFLDLSHLQHSPLNVISLIDSSTESFQLPVFLFTWADLIDISEVLITLLRYTSRGGWIRICNTHFVCFSSNSYRPDCVLIFIPERRMKEAAIFLMEAQEWYSRKGQLTGMVFFSSFKNPFPLSVCICFPV